MSQLMEQAFQKARQLPESDQDAIATLILQEIEAEQRWEEGKEATPDFTVGHAPNLKALAILQQIHERLQGRASSDSSKTQGYLREARSGGMYGDSDD